MSDETHKVPINMDEFWGGTQDSQKGINAARENLRKKAENVATGLIPGQLIPVKDVKTVLQPDMVNHPPHYKTGKIEVIDFLEDQKFEYHEGNAVKYISRAQHKGARIQDLKKAVWYLNRKIELLEKQNEAPRT